MWDILGVGVVAVDDLLYVDRYPGPDEKEPVGQRLRQGGGLTGTALVAAARLGARAAYCGVLGEDELSRFTLDELRREGIDCEPVVIEAAARPMYSVIVVVRPTGQRTILAGREGWRQVPTDVLTRQLIGQCRILFIDHTVPESALYAARIARELGIAVVADIEQLEIPGIEELLESIDHLILNRRTAEQLSGQDDAHKAVEALASPARRAVVVTDGAQGCWYAGPDGAVRHQPAFTVPVVDTTGCGDVFHGAYAACLAGGRGLAESIRIAAATSALKATRPGGRQGIPDAAAVAAFLGDKGELLR